MRNYQTKKLVEISLLSSVIFLLTFTELGYPKFGPINSTIIHLPVLFGVLYFATLKESIILGFVFGISSFLKVWLMPTSPLDVIFLNPLVSIFPRVLTTIIGYFLMVKWFHKWAVFPLTFWVSLIHSFLVLTMMYLLYNNFIASTLSLSTLTLLSGIFLTSSMIEAALAGFVVPALNQAIKGGK